MSTHWYLIHTKPKQEMCALQNLEQQGYPCYLPTLPTEKLRQGALVVTEEPLFPRYLFIRLGNSESDKSWSPIRSTRGVNRLVSFGLEPAKVDDELIAFLQAREQDLLEHPEPLFKPGDRVRLTEGALANLEGVFQMKDGANRVVVLLELLSKPVSVRVFPSQIRKAI